MHFLIDRALFSEAATRCLLRKKCSENKQQIYRRTLVPKCDFNKVALQCYIEITLRNEHCPVNLLHIFRTPFYKNTYGKLPPYFAKTTK